MKITDTLEEIKSIDHKILHELDQENVSIDSLNSLYDLRRVFVQGLSNYTLDSNDFTFDLLNEATKKVISDSLTVIHLLEKKINRKLAVALENRARILERISITRRARYSYNQSYNQDTSVFVDIK